MKRPSLSVVLEILRSVRKDRMDFAKRIENVTDFDSGYDEALCYALSLLDVKGSEAQEHKARVDARLGDGGRQKAGAA